MLSIKELVTEEQDPKVIEKVLPKGARILHIKWRSSIHRSSKEKRLALTFRPGLYCFNKKRIILIRPKSFGLSLDFKDFSWMNVADVHMKEGVFAATITIKTTSGQTDSMEDIPKFTSKKTLSLLLKKWKKRKKRRTQTTWLRRQTCLLQVVELQLINFAVINQ